MTLTRPRLSPTQVCVVMFFLCPFLRQRALLYRGGDAHRPRPIARAPVGVKEAAERRALPGKREPSPHP